MKRITILFIVIFSYIGLGKCTDELVEDSHLNKQSPILIQPILTEKRLENNNENVKLNKLEQKTKCTKHFSSLRNRSKNNRSNQKNRSVPSHTLFSEEELTNIINHAHPLKKRKILRIDQDNDIICLQVDK